MEVSLSAASPRLTLNISEYTIKKFRLEREKGRKEERKGGREGEKKGGREEISSFQFMTYELMSYLHIYCHWENDHPNQTSPFLLYSLP